MPAGGAYPGGPGGHDGSRDPWSRPARQIDDDPDRVLTPTTIFAPGSLVNPPDGGDGGRREPGPPAGLGGVPPGYAPSQGQGSWQAPGGYPQPGPFPGPGGAPGPGPAGGFAGPGPLPPDAAHPGPGGFPAGGAGDARGYGYQPPGYGTPRPDHPYPGPGGPSGQQYPGPQYPGQQYPGQQYPGQPGVQPGYAQDPGQAQRQAPGWRGPDGFPPSGDTRAPSGQPYPGGQGQAGPGQAGYPPPGYAGHGAFQGPAAPPPGHGYPGQYPEQSGYPGQHPEQSGYPGQYPEQSGYPGAGGFAGPDGSPPYAEYRVWSPQAAPGYPETDAHGDPVNGGRYAHVIRQDDLADPSSRPDAGGMGQAPGGRQAQDAAAGPAGRAWTGTRAITSGEPGTTAGATTKPEVAPEVDPAFAYGPDDPAYGPPGPDWYKQREEEQAARAVDAQPAAAATEPSATRGPFEPLSQDEREKAGYAVYQPADADPAFDEPDGNDADQAGNSEGDLSDDDAIALEHEMSELLDFGESADPEVDALGRIMHLYEGAENVSEAGLDSHFERLLARQRQLISEFFEESGAIGPADAPTSPAPAVAEDSATPFGFDSADSLTSLRGELWNAQ